MLTKDHAICIRVTDYSETSQIVTLFARLSGKVRAIAKGSKRPKSALEGPIEVLSFGAIVFSGFAREKLATLTEFQPQPVQGELRRNLFALHACLLAAELLNLLTDDCDPHAELYDQFLQLLQDLDGGATGGERRDIMLRLILFQFALLHEVGLRPVLSTCANCKRLLAGSGRNTYFSESANGLICRDCEMSFPDKTRLSPKATACLTDMKRIAEAEEKTLDEIEGVLIRHFTHILGHAPKTAKLILGK